MKILLFLIITIAPLKAFADCHGCEDCPYFNEYNYYKDKIDNITYKNACEKDSDCLLQKGNVYFFGCGEKRDYKTAITWFKKSARLGNNYAKYKIAEMNLLGKGTNKNAQNALRGFLSDPLQNGLGFYQASLMFLEGHGVTKNLGLALLYAEKAKEKGNTEAIKLINQIKSIDNEKTLKEAIKTYKKAVNGDPDAKMKTAYNYLYGIGFNKDYKEAESWFSASAMSGFSCAYCELGNIYWNGNTGKENRELALSYWKKGISLGCVDFIPELAKRYYYGDGLTKSKEKALELLESCKDENKECKNLF